MKKVTIQGKCLNIAASARRSVNVKANEFVKKFGLGAAKDILKNKRSWIDKKSGRKLTDNSFVLKSKTYEYAIGTLYMGNFSDYDENSYRVDVVNLLLLKRLVESHELVEKLGGLDIARKEAHKNCFVFNVKLLRAIADVESCL